MNYLNKFLRSLVYALIGLILLLAVLHFCGTSIHAMPNYVIPIVTFLLMQISFNKDDIFDLKFRIEELQDKK